MAAKQQKLKQDVEVAARWKEYVTLVKERDAARHEAEKHDRKRRASWVEYYRIEKEINAMNKELGIESDSEDNALNYETPSAPKKKRRERDNDE